MTWLPLSDSADGLRAVVDGVPVYVVPSRVFGWSWHAMPTDRAATQGYAPTVEAAQTLGERAARGVE